MNYLSVGVVAEVEDGSKEKEKEVEKTIKSEKDKNDLARLFYYAKESKTIALTNQPLAATKLAQSQGVGIGGTYTVIQNNK
jgi:hypothetical protein